MKRPRIWVPTTQFPNWNTNFRESAQKFDFRRVSVNHWIILRFLMYKNRKRKKFCLFLFPEFNLRMGEPHRSFYSRLWLMLARTLDCPDYESVPYCTLTEAFSVIVSQWTSGEDRNGTSLWYVYKTKFDFCKRSGFRGCCFTKSLGIVHTSSIWGFLVYIQGCQRYRTFCLWKRFFCIEWLENCLISLTSKMQKNLFHKQNALYFWQTCI